MQCIIPWLKRIVDPALGAGSTTEEWTVVDARLPPLDGYPVQTNDIDCGVFLLEFIRRRLNGLPMTFAQVLVLLLTLWGCKCVVCVTSVVHCHCRMTSLLFVSS